MKCIRSFLVAASVAAPLFAQSPPPSVHLPMPYDSGVVANPGASEAIVISFPVVVSGAHWMRLEFGEVRLAGDLLAGSGAKLRITSLKDAAVQEMNALHVAQWQRTSAYFNGDGVLVEVVAQPHTGGSRIVLDAVTVDAPVASPESICGPTDDRVLSNDPRCGRILPIGCTGWLINDCNRCELTAGHCTGSMFQMIEFNVPMSNPDMTINHPGPQDQYAIDAANVQTNGGTGAGDDWAYYAVFPNSNTGLTPGQVQGAGFTVMLTPPFNASEQLRVTGFGANGVMPMTWNQVEQTAVGAWLLFSGTTLHYSTDTQLGQSGSPIIHEPTGNAIGIHTHGQCGPVSGQNVGTASSHPGLQAALAVPAGLCAASIAPVGALPTQLHVGQATPIAVQVAGPIVAGTAQLHYRYQPGAFTTQALTAAGGGLFTGVLPAPACNDIAQFYFSVQNTTCGTLTNPASAPTAFYSAAVLATEVPILADDFETDQGWLTSVNGATGGAWERGVPIDDPNWAFDPSSDADGSGQCYLTQNTPGNSDVDAGSVTLTSPPLDLAGGNVIVRYSYYLNLTIADGTDQLRVEMSSNGLAGPWLAVATHVTNNGTAWMANELDAGELAAAGVTFTPNMRLRFTALDAGTASVVEAGVDGVQVVRSVCSLFESYCVSGTLGSVITATGSSSIAANDLVLHANHIPLHKNGMFFYGHNRANFPFGDGTRCVANPCFRLGLFNSGSGTTLDYALNYNSLTPLGAINAGDLWNFQCWFRDNIGPFDLSNALQVTFTP